MKNMGQIINSHNRKLLRKEEDQKMNTKPCNCHKFECPLKNGKTSCRTQSVIYQATVTTKKETRTYIGLTANEFKTRYYQHRHDFTKEENKEKTELSKYIWEQKNNNTDYQLSWKIIRKVRKMENGNKICRLCLTEAMEIIKNKTGQLNKRNEIMNKCRHKNKFLLKNWKEKKKRS